MNTIHTSKKILIAGAGQFGRSAATLLNTEELQIIGLSDNNPALWNTCFHHPIQGSVPILSPQQALELNPDLVLTGVIDEERTEELILQFRSLGYTGEFLTLRSLYLHLDIRSSVLLRLATRIHDLKIQGVVAELGVYKGDLARKLNALFPDRDLYLFDTFEGFSCNDIDIETEKDCSKAAEGDFSDTSVELVRSRMPHPQQVVFRKGYFPDTAVGLEDTTFALVSLDADLYAPILAGLRFFWPRLSKGGMILLHDYGNQRFHGARQAVEAFENENGTIALVPLCDLHGSAVLIKG
ncbi:MAG: TylF/MycF/NovP-related O-methyltransferase [Lachnospiraceae bacterium]|nr:TylF/MycF/NovP-related O-methyltransferase [Lachnospiraceae bacterium]